MSKLNTEVQYEPEPGRLNASTRITFANVKAITKTHSHKEGALLLEVAILDEDTGDELAIEEYWIPKKLCRNLEQETDGSGTVYIWTPFLESSKQSLLKNQELIDEGSPGDYDSIDYNSLEKADSSELAFNEDSFDDDIPF